MNKKILRILTFPIYCLLTFIVIMGVQFIDGLDMFWKTVTMNSSNKVTWKVVMNYGGGYRVENTEGKTVVQQLSSVEALRLAKLYAEAMNISVEFTYWEETPDGVVQVPRFGS